MSNRVAVVTGGSGGIGRAVAERLAADGQAVVVHYAGNRAAADETVAAITSAGGSAVAVGGDVADEAAMGALFDEAERRFGGVDVVVNTAGIMLLGPVAAFDLADFDRMHRTNVRGTFVVAQQAARRLRGGGALIMVSTSITRLQQPAYAAYAATKGAVQAMTLILARELGGRDITVNTAGIMLLGPVAEFDLAAFDRMHRTNVRGTFVVAQQAARRVRGGGALITFSTSITRLQQPAYAAYAATKGAVEAMTLILARELRGRDITVNTVAPGPTATPLFLDGKPQEVVDRLAAASPLGRLGTPEDIARVVAVLAGPDGRWINGQTVFANGGIA